MSLPNELTLAIEHELAYFKSDRLSQAATELSEAYRTAPGTLRLLPEHHAAYSATRMPATYAVIERVMQEIQTLLPKVSFHTLLDIGAGPGTALWAATTLFPEIEKATLIERDSGFSKLGQRLAQSAENPTIKEATWKLHNLNQALALSAHDLVIASYSLGELSTNTFEQAIKQCLDWTRQALVVIEPGTPRGYATLMRARDQLLAQGAHVVAPCPHQLACPIAGNDWCHFSQRLDRTQFHRQIKNVSLSYEDEKYCYLVVTKPKLSPPSAHRLIRKPLKRTGHIYLDLCTTDGQLKREVITRSDKESMRRAKKAEWGDTWESHT